MNLFPLNILRGVVVNLVKLDIKDGIGDSIYWASRQAGSRNTPEDANPNMYQNVNPSN
jgi:hypothetical protein